MDIDGRPSCPHQMQLFPRCAAHPSKGLGGTLGCGDLERSRVEFLGSDPLLTFIVAALPNLQVWADTVTGSPPHESRY